MDVPFELTDGTVHEIPHVDLLSGSHWHTDECECNQRRLRTIVDRYPEHDAELWGCGRCGALYWRPTVVADYQNAPRQMRNGEANLVV